MARVNFREVESRFTHIDARFVRSCCDLPSGTGTLEVSLYPWWEHPLYVKAVREGERWGFRGLPDDAYRTVAVHALNLYEAKFSQGDDVIDWYFTQRHPLLWQFEDSAQIFCNQSLTVETWLAVLGETSKSLKLHGLGQILEWAPIDPVLKYGSRSQFHLGSFPRPVFLEVRSQLQARGIDVFAPGEPKESEVPVLFMIDGVDYMIADDFEIDLPEFEHRDEWFGE